MYNGWVIFLYELYSSIYLILNFLDPRNVKIKYKTILKLFFKIIFWNYNENNTSAVLYLQKRIPNSQI